MPAESAFPGYGDLCMIEKDHIRVCKPVSTEDVAYKKLEEFIEKSLKEAGLKRNATPEGSSQQASAS